jgi:hypothetical protein
MQWSQWPGLNRRPTVYETVALPLSYIGVQNSAAFEIGANVKPRCSNRHQFLAEQGRGRKRGGFESFERFQKGLDACRKSVIRDPEGKTSFRWF